MHSLFCWLGVRSFELAPGSCLSGPRRVAAEYRVLGSSAAIQGGATPAFRLECSTFIDGKIERKTSKMKLFLAKTRENCVFSEYTQEAQGSTECTEEIRNRYPTKEARLKVDSGKMAPEHLLRGHFLSRPGSRMILRARTRIPLFRAARAGI